MRCVYVLKEQVRVSGHFAPLEYRDSNPVPNGLRSPCCPGLMGVVVLKDELVLNTVFKGFTGYK